MSEPIPGELHDHVEMVRLREGPSIASWLDEEGGLLAQIICDVGVHRVEDQSATNRHEELP